MSARPAYGGPRKLTRSKPLSEDSRSQIPLNVGSQSRQIDIKVRGKVSQIASHSCKRASLLVDGKTATHAYNKPIGFSLNLTAAGFRLLTRNLIKFPKWERPSCLGTVLERTMEPIQRKRPVTFNKRLAPPLNKPKQ